MVSEKLNLLRDICFQLYDDLFIGLYEKEVILLKDEKLDYVLAEDPAHLFFILKFKSDKNFIIQIKFKMINSKWNLHVVCSNPSRYAYSVKIYPETIEDERFLEIIASFLKGEQKNNAQFVDDIKFINKKYLK